MLPHPVKCLALLSFKQEIADCCEKWYVEQVSLLLMNAYDTLQKPP